MNIVDTLKFKSKQAAVVGIADYITKYLQKDPEKNFDSMMKRLISLDSMFGGGQGQFKAVMEWATTHPGTRKWFTTLMSRNPEQVRTFVKNFFGNCSLMWMERAKAMGEKYGLCPPYTILLSPTMRCNLNCRGCYASSYPKKHEDMPIEVFDKIISEGKELGIYFYTILGGEPFLVFDSISEMATKHSDCLFQLFTNGTLITDEIAEKIRDLKNVVVAFSVNGTREETDDMRGTGVYDRVLESVKKMRERNLMYGISLVLTSVNYTTFMSRDFLKFWEDQGVVFGWNFLFMPVGPNPDLSLMPTPMQRVTFGEFIKEYREQEPLYLMDFWADAPSVHGCIAGGRRYLHITNKGDIEPCIFAHYATHNINDCHLLDALQSPFFTYIRMNQPHTDNLLRPCMIIDNPGIWRNACRLFNARPTDLGAENLVENPEVMAHIDQYARQTAEYVNPLWKQRYRHKIDDMYSRKRSYGEGIDRIEYLLNRDMFDSRIEAWRKNLPEFAQCMKKSLQSVIDEYGADPEVQIKIIEAPIKTRTKTDGEESVPVRRDHSGVVF